MTPDSPHIDETKEERGEFTPAVQGLEVKSENESLQAKYNLTKAEKEEAVRLLIERKLQPTESRYGVYVVESSDPAANLGRAVELEVFGEFFDNNEELMKREYGPYEQDSTFIIVLDKQTSEPAGVMRLIQNGPNGLKSLNDLSKEPWLKGIDAVFEEDGLSPHDLDKTWDIATLAVRKEYRGKTAVSAALYHALYLSSEKRQIENWVAILDDNVLELLGALGIHFKRYVGVGSANYLDSPASTPVYGNKPEIVDYLRVNSPDAYNYLVLGKGLEVEADFQTIE